jgi:hypothetical protein
MTFEEIVKEELAIQRQMIELLLEENVALNAKVAALEEALIVHEVLDKSELETLEQAWYQDVALERMAIQ